MPDQRVDRLARARVGLGRGRREEVGVHGLRCDDSVVAELVSIPLGRHNHAPRASRAAVNLRVTGAAGALDHQACGAWPRLAIDVDWQLLVRYALATPAMYDLWH